MIFAFRLLAAEGGLHTHFELGRIQSNADWILPLGACLAILLFVRAMYRRDALELPRLLGWFLTALRAATFLGLLFLFLQPQWRSERELVRNSRVALLVDTSLSMGLSDSEAATSPGGPSRIGQVAAALAQTELLPRLRKTHDVAVYQFNNRLDPSRMVTLEKLTAAAQKGTVPFSSDPASQGARNRDSPRPSGKPAGGEGTGDQPHDRAAIPGTVEQWTKFLTPAGSETRLGEALQQVIHQERGGTLAGVVLVSDGGQNAGAGPEAAIELAREANKVPIFTVGLGSAKKPASVRVNDLVVPVRAYPGDRYPITGYLQAQGLAGRVVTVQLLSREIDAPGDRSRLGSGRVEASQQVILGGDGEALPVKFELTPDKVGRRTLCFRIGPVAGQRDQRDQSDNYREADIEIVDRKNHVLLLAGGPTRDYQFLRTLLYRDHFTTLDVLLQTAQSNISQEATKILDEFPSTRQEMFDYDCVVAFDPDWQALTAAQIEVLHDWVDGQGGGLIVVAGPVNAGKGVNSWIQDPAMAKIRNLYPVEFPRQFSALENFTYAAEEPWPLEFTREGLQADFLWLGEDVAAGREAWSQFAGVYSFFPVRGAKPGATVLATFSDPRVAQSGKQPPYFVEQFYGSGRVFYLGSGEMWRLRHDDPTYYEQFYTKLIRHVSQGRLLRGSARGTLMVGQSRYLLGNTVEVRARLSDARLQPLAAAAVTMEVIPPNGAVQQVKLAADPGRAGNFAGQFSVLQEGVYRLELPLPETADQRLSARIQVKVPELERENPQRNDALLSHIAKQSGGRYYVGIPAVLGKALEQPLAELLADRTKIELATVAPNPHWEETWLRWLMIALCSLLCLEWLIRRLMRLA
jgi:hypothetical protein